MAPGERFARGRLEKLLEPSPHRVDPACAHYRIDDCGGCQLQHLRYPAQLDAKAGIVFDAFERIAKRAVGKPIVRESERQWRYRTKLTLAMRQNASEWVIGLHKYDDPGAVFQLTDCPITDERVMHTWTEIRRASDHFPRAKELRCAVRLGGNGSVVVMEGGRRWTKRDAFFEAVPSATALWWKPEMGTRQLVRERVREPAGASFTQINVQVAASLRDYVVGRAMSYTAETVVDAYAGIGDAAVLLAQSGARVTAIEVDRDAARLCARRLPSDSRVLVGRVESLLARALPADVVILNPPRAGLHERVPLLLQQRAERLKALIYVSCNPATLARDVSRLASYRIASVVAFDMFPQTAHVETVCELVGEAS
jgi:23S rRNA (uracil1939-C5)-methyltransferase